MAETTTTDGAASTEEADAGKKQTYTHEDFERELGRRLKRQRDQFPTSEELDGLREKAKQFEAIEETSKDDLERANDKITKLEADIAAKNSEVESLTTKLRDTTVKQLVIAEAAKAQYGEEKADTFVDPEDAFTNLDVSKVEFDEDGNATNIADLVSAVAASKPHYLGARRQAGPDMDLGARETATDRPDMSPEQEHAQWLASKL